MVRVPTQRAPTHPGEMLLEEFLVPMGLTQRELSQAIHVPYQRINEVINERRGITPGTALRLEKFFGVSAGFWMNLQLRWDLYYAREEESKQLEGICPRVIPAESGDYIDDTAPSLPTKAIKDSLWSKTNRKAHAKSS